MLNMKYKASGVEVGVSFETKLDMILFVAANRIKDEDLVSIDFGDGDITGGIDGLASYVVNKVTEEKERIKALKEAEISGECNDHQSCSCNESNEEDKHVCNSSREEREFYNLKVEDGIEDEYLTVDNVENDGGIVRFEFWTGDSVLVEENRTLCILENGQELEPYEFINASVIKEKAKNIQIGDIVVNR